MPVSNEQIFTWIEAADIQERFAQEPQHIRDAVLAAEQWDRAKIIDRAIREPLEADRAQRAGAGSIVPFTLVTEGIQYATTYHRGNTEEYQRFYNFRESVWDLEGRQLGGVAMGNLMKFMFNKKSWSRYGRDLNPEEGVIERSEQGITFLSPDPEAYQVLIKKEKNGTKANNALGPTTLEGLVRFMQGARVYGLRAPGLTMYPVQE